MNRLMKWKIYIITAFGLFASWTATGQEYCAAIRGNGELVPAQWSAFSRVVENYGMPKAMAGGSSASITMMIMEAIANSSLTQKGEDLKLQQALLIKSILPYFMQTYLESGLRDLSQLILTPGTPKNTLLKIKEMVLNANNRDTLLRVIEEFGPLFNKNFTEGLKGPQFAFYKSQLLEAIEHFGKFNALEDGNLFFREGLIDFGKLGIHLGRAADFLAGRGSEETNNLLRAYLDQCSQKANGLLWSELVQKAPECQKMFSDAFSNYYNNREFPDIAVHSQVGSVIPAFPTTAVIAGSSAAQFAEAKKNYIANFKESEHSSYVVNFYEDMYFGYWGSESQLKKISTTLKSDYGDDLKSQRFVGLGEARWGDVISFSPAEPGLASLLPFPTDQKLIYALNSVKETNAPYVSAGGWSDLHPVLVLKAHGCKNTLYITRTDGESVFGQQVFIRLTGDTDTLDFWDRIKEKNKEGWPVTEKQSQTPWHHLYNLANNQSSYRTSIKSADAVYCTDWNSYDVFGGELDGLVRDAYNAPVNVLNENSSLLFVNQEKQTQLPGCY